MTQPPPYFPAVMRWRTAVGSWLKKKLVPDSSERRRWWWDRFFLQVHAQYFFVGKSREDIYNDLLPARARSVAVLDEALSIVADEETRRAHIERRATGLQGSIAIAAGFGLAGGGLILDAGKLPSTAWRVAVGAAYLTAVVCLAGTGLRALRASVRVHAFEIPDPRGPVMRAEQPDDESRLRRAAELLYSYGRNQAIGDYQLSQMKAAGHWFAAALATVVITAVLVVAAAAFGTHPSTQARTGAASHAPSHSP